jgi:hypothetical protein
MKTLFTFFNSNTKLKTTTLALVIIGCSHSFKAQSGASLDFDGINDNVQVPLINFSAANKMTVEAWIKPTDITTNTYYEISRQENSPSPDWLLSFQNNGTILSFGLKTTTGYTELHVTIVPSNYTNGVWHHVAATYDGTLKTLYVDGVWIGNEFKTGNIMFTGFGHYIGSRAGINEFFKGEIDEVRYWNYARNACDINTFKNIEIPTTDPGLLGNYHFNQGIAAGNNLSVTTLSDAAGGVGTGTLIGFSLTTGTLSNWVAASPAFAKITGPSPICEGTSSSYTLMALPGAFAWSWTFPGGWSGLSGSPNTFATAGPNLGNISVVISSTCASTATITTTVNVNPAPTISVVPSNTLLCVGQSVTFTASGGLTYTWSPDPSLNTTSGPVVVATPTVTTTYQVIGTNSFGCNKAFPFIQNVSTCTGISTNSLASDQISVYPNPNSGSFKLQIDTEIQDTEIVLFNSFGQQVHAQKISQGENKITTNGLSKGLYHYTLSENKHQIHNGKIVLE